MKRVKAFTLIELLVAMVLSGIVINLTYKAYRHINDSFHLASGQYHKTNEILQLQALINQDCSNAHFAKFENEQLTMQRLDNSMVNYTLTDEGIIRDDLDAIDTFLVGKPEYNAEYLFGNSLFLEKLELNLIITSAVTYTISAQVNYTNEFKFAKRYLKVKVL